MCEFSPSPLAVCYRSRSDWLMNTSLGMRVPKATRQRLHNKYLHGSAARQANSVLIHQIDT